MKRTNFISYATAVGFSIFIFFNLLLLCFTSYAKEAGKLDTSNILLTIIGISAFVAASVLPLLFKQKASSFFNAINAKTIAIASAFIFLLQIIFCYNIYFFTGWDSGCVLKNAVSWLNGTEILPSHQWYYSTYPNNLLITAIYTALFKLLSVFGISSTEALLLGGLVLQCAVSSFCGYLVYRICEQFSGKACAFFAWLLYIFLIGFNPWISILYSDSTALFIPICILRLYQLTENGKKVYAKWLVIGLLSYIGFKIKPQCVIVTIAVLIIDIFLSFNFSKQFMLAALKKSASILLGVLLVFTLFNTMLVKNTPFKLNPDKRLGAAHYLMMGLNEKTVGGYSDEDVNFSSSKPTTQTRTKANIEESKNRIKNFGVFGLAKHLAKKAVKTYSDGTFGWSGEGTFYKTVLPEKNDTLSPFLRSIFYKDGKYYGVYKSIMQAVWLAMLFSSLGIIPYFVFNKPSRTLTVLILSLIGLTMFQLLFETRARYLYIYSPFFVMLSIFGWLGLYYLARHISKYFRRFSKNLP